MLVIELTGVLDDSQPLAAGVPVNPRKAIGVPLASDFLVRGRFLKANGGALNLAGGSLTMTIKKRATDTNYVVARTATIESAGGGVASFRFVPVDTKRFEPGRYAYDIWFTDADGVRNSLVPTSPFELQAAVTLPSNIGNVPFFPPATPTNTTGWITITDINVSGGTAYAKTYDDAPANTILQSATISGLNLLVDVKCAFPRVTVGGVSAVLAQDVGGGFYSGTVACSVAGTSSLTAQLTTPDGALGALDTASVTYVAPPTILTLAFTGPYPGVQTELKAGDTYQVAGTLSAAAVGVEVQNTGAGTLQSIAFPSSTSFTVTITIADRGNSPQSLAATLRAVNSGGAYGPTAATSNTVVLNNLHPTVTFGAKTYPIGQSALKGSETADVAVTLANLDSVLFTSPNGDLSIASPAVIAASKTVTRIAGSYNVATNNLTATATRAANAAVTAASTVVAVANVAPVVGVAAPAARLRSGGNDGTAVQGHVITLTSDQQLLNAPTLAEGVGGGTFAGVWAGGPTAWTRTLNVSDNDTKGTYAFNGLVATGLAGLVQNSLTGSANYVLGGFVPRSLTFPAFSQSATLNTGVVDYSKLTAGVFTATNQPALKNGVQGNTTNIVDTYTVLTLANVGPITLWWNDVSAAATNSTGTAAITLVEETV